MPLVGDKFKGQCLIITSEFKRKKGCVILWENSKIMLMNALSLTEIQQDSRSANLLEASFIKFEIYLLEDIGYSSNEITKICLLSIW